MIYTLCKVQIFTAARQIEYMLCDYSNFLPRKAAFSFLTLLLQPSGNSLNQDNNTTTPIGCTGLHTPARCHRNCLQSVLSGQLCARCVGLL